jgi:tRNA pseudouridine13 synthase
MKPELATVLGGPAGQGTLRAVPADFHVDEVLGFEPDGDGEHALLWIRKQDANTADVATALARFADVPPRAVGFSGRKDRHADTGQWFSVHLAGRADPDWRAFSGANWQVEYSARHRRRLRTGTHRANRFRLRIRDFHGNPDAVHERLAAIGAEGFPNYFGPQRFGRGGQNLQRARNMLAGTQRVRRNQRSMYLSAARSWLFNLVLDTRIRAGIWRTPLAGDALMLAGTHSMFCCSGEELDLDARITALDVHVTGPLWGEGRRVADERADARERAWLGTEHELVAALEALALRPDRRSLRAVVSELDWQLADETLELAFTLPSGSFATALLAEVVTTTEP